MTHAAQHHHHDRIGQRARHLRAQGDLLVQEVGQPRQHGVQVAGGLARADHVVYSSGNTRGCCASASASAPPSFTRWRTPARITCSLRLSACSASARQRLGQRDARLQQGRQLAGEDGHLRRPHPLEQAARSRSPACSAVLRRGARRRRRAAACRPTTSRMLGQEDGVLAQDRAQPLGPVGLAGAGDGLAAGVQSLPGVKRHPGLLRVLRGHHQDLGGAWSCPPAPSGRRRRAGCACPWPWPAFLMVGAVGVLVGQLADGVVDHQQLVDGGPAPVAGAQAARCSRPRAPGTACPAAGRLARS